MESAQDRGVHVLEAALPWLPLPPHLVLGVATLLGLLLALGVIIPALPHARRELSPLLRRLCAPAVAVAVSAPRTIGVIFLLAFLSGAANGLVRFPVPSVNDEFGYLLAADTFAQGRLANPVHPLWPHFETVGVSHQPAYVSKYPPGQAVFLTLGQVLLGHPWWGQLLVYSLAAAAVAWMLRAWVGPRWALVGGVLVALHPNMQHFQRYDYGWANYSWSHSYWGGAAAMLGAALVFGGLRYFVRRPRAGYAVALASGAVLLANTRPFEGFVLCLPVAVVLLVRAARGQPEWPIFLRRFVVPASLVALPAIGFMLMNNAAATGSPLRLAHQHYANQYGVAAELLIQEPRTPPERYGNVELKRFYLDWVRPNFELRRSSLGAYLESREKGLGKLAWFFFSTTWPALLVFPLLLGSGWWRFVAGMWALSLLMLLLTFDFHPHYAAPVAPLVFAGITAGLAKLARIGGPFGLASRSVLFGVIVCTFALRLWTLPASQYHEVQAKGDWPRTRAFLIDRLEERPGKDVVLVTTGPHHYMFQVWLHNPADLEDAPVIFARDLGIPMDQHPVLAHYTDRNLWHLTLDVDRSFLPVARAGPYASQ